MKATILFYVDDKANIKHRILVIQGTYSVQNQKTLEVARLFLDIMPSSTVEERNLLAGFSVAMHQDEIDGNVKSLSNSIKINYNMLRTSTKPAEVMKLKQYSYILVCNQLRIILKITFLLKVQFK